MPLDSLEKSRLEQRLRYEIAIHANIIADYTESGNYDIPQWHFDERRRLRKELDELFG